MSAPSSSSVRARLGDLLEGACTLVDDHTPAWLWLTGWLRCPNGWLARLAFRVDPPSSVRRSAEPWWIEGLRTEPGDTARLLLATSMSRPLFVVADIGLAAEGLGARLTSWGETPRGRS